uniref:Haloacid dehalogenase-like hydrolase, putative n=1 Tax=Oryza sativa subsp. japonica TaxID=39947 RepID=Q53NS4_ORYSJ|nr:haloacid dehalogenase-like hydrolase, putative [Oryza sativa Japonica Group]
MAARPATDGEGVDASVPWWRRKRPRLPPPPPEADAEEVKAEALALMAAHPVLPRLVVFDLDHTLWPFQCDATTSGIGSYMFCITTESLSMCIYKLHRDYGKCVWVLENFLASLLVFHIQQTGNGTVIRATGIISAAIEMIVKFLGDRLPKDEPPYLYPQARGILKALKDRGIEMAIASRASRKKGVAKAFLEKLGIHFMFGAQEIFYTWSPKNEHFQSIHRKTGVPFKSMLFFDDEARNIIATRKLGVSCVLVDTGITLEKLRTGLSNYANRSASPNAEPAGGRSAEITWYLDVATG